MTLTERLEQSIGKAATWALLKIVRQIQIAIDADDQTVTIYRNGHEPLRTGFRDIEKFVNDTH